MAVTQTMRRRLNTAYLAQLLLMVIVIVLLMLLAWRGSSPLVFSLTFISGILLATAPSIYSRYVLPRQEFQRAGRVLESGLPVRARVLQDGEAILAEFQRTTMGYKGVSVLLDVPVLLLGDEEHGPLRLNMKTDLDSLPRLKSGMVVSAVCDPEDPDYLVICNLSPEQGEYHPD